VSELPKQPANNPQSLRVKPPKSRNSVSFAGPFLGYCNSFYDKCVDQPANDLQTTRKRKFRFAKCGKYRILRKCYIRKICRHHMWLTNAVRSIVSGRLHPDEWDTATFARFVKMLAIAAWCERCSESHSEAQDSIACAICSRGSRASSPGAKQFATLE
jgi:hypothetical protein